MIRSFRSKALQTLWSSGSAARLDTKLVGRIKVRLSMLDAAAVPGDMEQPGFDYHPLRGKPQRYTVHINGPWCITFGWDGNDAIQVDLENYH